MGSYIESVTHLSLPLYLSLLAMRLDLPTFRNEWVGVAVNGVFCHGRVFILTTSSSTISATS